MPARRIIALCLVLLLLSIGSAYAGDEGLKVVFIDVGQGDAALLECDGEAMMIDTGTVSAWPHIQDVLKSERFAALKYLVATHPHQDHVANVARIIENYHVGAVILPPIDLETLAYSRMMSAINDNGIRAIYPRVGDTFTLGGALITVYAPYPVAYSNPNDWSIVLMATYEGRSILFCADAEYESEMDMLAACEEYPLKADVLKVGHHGSDTSSSYDFIKAVSPSIAIVSCGDNDQYPDTDVAMTLVECGAMLYTTKTEGDIIIALPPERLAPKSIEMFNVNSQYGSD